MFVLIFEWILSFCLSPSKTLICMCVCELHVWSPNEAYIFVHDFMVIVHAYVLAGIWVYTVQRKLRVKFKDKQRMSALRQVPGDLSAQSYDQFFEGDEKVKRQKCLQIQQNLSWPLQHVMYVFTLLLISKPNCCNIQPKYIGHKCLCIQKY